MRTILSILVLICVTAAAIAETGAACFTRACRRSGSIRQCYTCCNSNCTDAVGCQNRCDGSNPVLAPLSDLKFDQAAMVKLLESEKFYAPVYTWDDSEIVAWVTCVGEPPTVRWALAVASERLIEAKMDEETRDATRLMLVDSLYDSRSSDIRMTAIACLEENGMDFEHDILIRLLNIVADDLEEQRVRDRALDAIFN